MNYISICVLPTRISNFLPFINYLYNRTEGTFVGGSMGTNSQLYMTFMKPSPPCYIKESRLLSLGTGTKGVVGIVVDCEACEAPSKNTPQGWRRVLMPG